MSAISSDLNRSGTDLSTEEDRAWQAELQKIREKREARQPVSPNASWRRAAIAFDDVFAPRSVNNITQINQTRHKQLGTHTFSHTIQESAEDPIVDHSAPNTQIENIEASNDQLIGKRFNHKTEVSPIHGSTSRTHFEVTVITNVGRHKHTTSFIVDTRSEVERQVGIVSLRDRFKRTFSLLISKSSINLNPNISV